LDLITVVADNDRLAVRARPISQRLVDRFDGLAEHPACHAYVARATARPAFVKAYADQMAHFAAADG
jgi:glutathione S-transferase